MRLEMGGINHQLVRRSPFTGKRREDAVEDAQAAPAHEAVIQGLVRTVSRMNCQMFSTGFSSGALGGNSSRVMLGGTVSLPVVCHAARSMMSTA